jgi:hypothetical protein
MSAKSLNDPLAMGVDISFDGDSFDFFALLVGFDLWYESMSDHSGVNFMKLLLSSSPTKKQTNLQHLAPRGKCYKT